MGLLTKDLLPTVVSLNCANLTEAGVLGMFYAKVSGKSVVDEKEITASCQVYVVKGKCCLLSRAILSALGCLPEEFPEIGRFSNPKATNRLAGGTSQNIFSLVVSSSGVEGGESMGPKEPVRQPAGECDPDSSLPCSCKRRQFTYPPDTMPMPATASNREALEKYIKARKKANAFDACKRQS